MAGVTLARILRGNDGHMPFTATVGKMGDHYPWHSHIALVGVLSPEYGKVAHHVWVESLYTPLYTLWTARPF